MEDGNLRGRSHELHQARHALESGRGLLVTGVAGVGKTRFVAELARVLTDAGASVLLTNSAHAVADLAALEAQHPIVIVDDAHRLDPRLLEMLCENAAHGAITLCLAGLPASEVDASVAVPMMEHVRAWLSGTGAPRLRLPMLSRAATVELATALAAPHELGAFWGEKIWRASGGLPALAEIYVSDAVRRNRLPQLPDLLDPEARELPPTEAIELVRPRLQRLDTHLIAALAVLGRLSGLPLDRAREAVRRGDITALADTELLEIRSGDETLHVLPVVTDVASSLLSAAEEDDALTRAAGTLLRFSPDGRRSPIEAVFLARVWMRRGATDPIDAFPPAQAREIVQSAARLYTQAGRARQSLELLNAFERTGAATPDADALILIERARATAALHDHDDALALLAQAEPLVRDVREARMLLNRYDCVLVWHLGDPHGFGVVAERARGWLPESTAWARELSLPAYFRRIAPFGGAAEHGTTSTFLAALPTHRGARATALAAAGLAKAAGDDTEAEAAEQLMRMAEAEASDAAGAGSAASGLTAAFSVSACAMLVALVRRGGRDALDAALERVVSAAVASGGQSAQHLAIAKWLEALTAQRHGDPEAARRCIECVDTRVLPERLQLWLEIEYARALARTGGLVEARALLRRLAPAVAASSDDWAAYGLMRAQISLKAATDGPVRADVLARTFALRVDEIAPALTTLLLRDARTASPDAAGAGTGAVADAATALAAHRVAEASGRTALVTPLTPALRGTASSLLSSREILVARLAVTGRTNAQIAAELFLSVRTVESHLHHARVKLGVSGRDGLAAFFGEPDGVLERAL